MLFCRPEVTISMSDKELRLKYPNKSEAWYRGWRLADMDLALKTEEKRLANEDRRPV